MKELGGLINADIVDLGSVGDSAFFLLDLSILGFAGLDFNVVMVSPQPQDVSEQRQIIRLLREYKQVVGTEGLCFHFILDAEYQPFIGDDINPDVITFNTNDIESLLASSKPRTALFTIIRRQVALQHLNPFSTAREARGSMFRGRKSELYRLISESQTSFLVTGARRIGKTSLLKKACDNLKERPDSQDRVHFTECSTWGHVYDCTVRLSHLIDPKSESRILRGERNISYLLQRRSRNGKRPIMLFFDEFDRLTDTDSSAGWQFLRLLHEAVTNNWVRVTFAGFRSVTRLYHDPQSPFYGALTVLALKPLTAAESFDLLAEPFREVGLSIRDREAVLSTVYSNTAGLPFLVQYYGEQLFQMATEYEAASIGIDDITKVESNFELNDFVLEYFLINTAREDTQYTLEWKCAMLLAHSEPGRVWTVQTFLDECNRLGLNVGPDEVLAALRNLYHTRLLNYENGAYSFIFPLIKKVLLSAFPEMDGLFTYS